MGNSWEQQLQRMASNITYIHGLKRRSAMQSTAMHANVAHRGAHTRTAVQLLPTQPQPGVESQLAQSLSQVLLLATAVHRHASRSSTQTHSRKRQQHAETIAYTPGPAPHTQAAVGIVTDATTAHPFPEATVHLRVPRAHLLVHLLRELWHGSLQQACGVQWNPKPLC